MMQTPFEFIIALRYLKSKRKTGVISLITYISVAGVVIGVAALIIILSVMNGFENEVRSRFLGIDGHVGIRRYYNEGISTYASQLNQIEEMPHIVAFSPYIHNKGMIITGKESTGLLLRGIDPETAFNVTNIKEALIAGKFDVDRLSLANARPVFGIVIGETLAKKINISLDDTVIVASLAGLEHLAQMPQMLRFQITGFFKTGIFEFDENFAFISIQSAQLLFNMPDQITGIKIKLDDYEFADAVAQEIENKLGWPYLVTSWRTNNQNLFAWMQIQKWAGFVMLSLIITVAAFNIVSTLIMVSMEKRKEIGILKSMGATAKSIRLIFTTEGLIVGIFGALIGSFLGFTLCWLQYKYKFLAIPADVYIIGWLPILMNWRDFALVTFAAIFLTLIASVYPAHKAANMEPVVAIRDIE